MRSAALACLDFLWSELGNEQRRKIAVEDPELRVWQSALWAYGFASNQGALELASGLAENNINLNVRKKEPLLEILGYHNEQSKKI